MEEKEIIGKMFSKVNELEEILVEKDKIISLQDEMIEILKEHIKKEQQYTSILEKQLGIVEK
jgi:phage regulator Rha-like protein